MVFRNAGVCSLFFQPLINTNFTKIVFSRPHSRNNELSKWHNFQNIITSYRKKIYIGCSSLPLNRAVLGLRASAKIRKLSCNILFRRAISKAKYWKSSRTLPFSKCERNSAQYKHNNSKSASIQTEQGERTQTDTEKQKGNSKCTGKTKTCSTENTLWRICESGAYRRDLRRYSNTTSRMKKSQNVVKEFNTVKKYSQ